MGRLVSDICRIFLYTRDELTLKQSYFVTFHLTAAEVQPRNQLYASYIEQHVAQSTWKSFVVECAEDYNLLYREIRQKLRIPINIILVPNGKLEPIRRMYSDQKFSVLKREHGFFEYLDETCTAPDPIMQAMISKHNIDKVLIGGEAVQQSLDRKDLENYISSKEDGSGKMSACYFLIKDRTSYKQTLQVNRIGDINVAEDEIGPAKTLQSGMDPREKEQLTQTINDAQETIERLTPDIEKHKAEHDKFMAEGQAITSRIKDAKRIKSDYDNYKRKLKNQRQKVADAEEAANTDNGREKSKRIAQIKKLIQANVAAGEDAAKSYSEVMKCTRVITGVKMSAHGLSESLRKLT
jgi:hypothetical protein